MNEDCGLFNACVKGLILDAIVYIGDSFFKDKTFGRNEDPE